MIYQFIVSLVVILYDPVQGSHSLFIPAQRIPQCQGIIRYMPRGIERSRDNTVLSHRGSKIACDSIYHEGRYRFYGAEIATSCVPTGRCGTQSTIWMKDPVPKIDETRLNRFCVNHGTSKDPNPCCSFSFQANVTNCGDFMVYHLDPSKLLCPSGFCTGHMKPCPPGRSSPTGFEPCTGTYPVISGPPDLSIPVLTNNRRNFTQTCTVGYGGNSSDAVFDLTWLFDSKPYKTVEVSGKRPSDSLSADDWVGHLGQTITPKSKYTYEGVQVKVQMRFGFPVVCAHKEGSECKLEFEIVVKRGNPSQILSPSGCSVGVANSDWLTGSHLTIINTEVSTNIDYVMKGRQTFIIAYRVVPNARRHPMWDNFVTDEITISTVEYAADTCMQLGDPLIISKDNKWPGPSITHLVNQPGVYNIFSSSSKHLKIEAQFWLPKATHHASSMCAVAFLYDSSLVKIDMCTDTPDTAAPIYSRTGQYQDDVQVYVCNSNYEIVTTDGFRMSVRTHKYNLDVRLHIPALFFHMKNGFCKHQPGSLLTSSSDLQHYEVSEKYSLFAHGSKMYINKQVDSPEYSKWCLCGNQSKACSPLQRVVDIQDIFTEDSEGKRTLRSECKKAASSPFFMSNYTTASDRGGPSPPKTVSTNIEKQIKDVCRQTIVNQSSSFCVTHNGDSLQTFVDGCALDYRESSSYEFIQSYVQGFQWSCEEKIMGNKSYYRTDRYGKMVPPVELTTSNCPNFCSGIGTCSNGRCSCPSGHFGNDCSLQKSGPLKISRLEGYQACPMSIGSCSSVTLVVNNIVQTSNITTLIQHNKFHQGMPESTNKTFILPVAVQTRTTVILDLSPVFSQIWDKTAFLLDIRITENGSTFSNSQQYTVFDDRCQFCRPGGPCMQLGNACHIDAQCFLPGEKNPKDAKKVCDPTNSVLSWTNTKDANPLG